MWDERYAQEELAYGAEPNDFLRDVAEHIPAGPVLCLAEGQGRNAVFLARRGHDVLAVDQSRVGMERAEQLALARGTRLRTQVADLADFRIEPGAWAGIVAISCHLPSALRRSVFSAAAAGLRPGGAFVLESYTPGQLALNTGGPPVLDLLVTLVDLKADLAGLRFEIGRELERDVIEGKYHTGRAAVVQVLAFKD